MTCGTGDVGPPTVELEVVELVFLVTLTVCWGLRMNADAHGSFQSCTTCVALLIGYDGGTFDRIRRKMKALEDQKQRNHLPATLLMFHLPDSFISSADGPHQVDCISLSGMDDWQGLLAEGRHMLRLKGMRCITAAQLCVPSPNFSPKFRTNT